MSDGQWSCTTCTFLNHEAVAECEMCSTPKPSANDSGLQDLPDSQLLAPGCIRQHSDVRNMIAAEFGFCNATLLEAVENMARKRMMLENYKLPPDWLLKIPMADMRASLFVVSTSLGWLKDICHIAHKEDEALRSQKCCGCGRDGVEVDLLTSHECDHQYCRKCVRSCMVKHLSGQSSQRIKCFEKTCHADLAVDLIRAVLSASEFNNYNQQCMNNFVKTEGTFVKCANAECGVVMEVLEPDDSKIPFPITEQDASGKPLSEAAWRHYNQYRIRCRECKTVFCALCHAAPYHKGFTCETFKEYQSAKHCRFCAGQLKGPDQKRPLALQDVCMSDECQQKADASCDRILECGHNCGGVVNEKVHPPCLHEDCYEEKDGQQSGSDFCNICWVDSLDSAPVLKLECGHLFHEQCINDKIEQKWPGIRITFGFLNCPLCQKLIKHRRLKDKLQPLTDLRTEIEKKSLIRLKVEGMEKDEKLTTRASRFYKKKLEFAMASFAYYNCFKCKKAYFGGRRDCEQNADAERRPPEEFICYDCSDLRNVSCKVDSHKEYHVYKCRFCCSIAVWFCWGTTHFCDACHSDEPWNRAKWPREKFTQCKGREYCALKIDHPPNGSEAECEFSLGCGMCLDDIRKQAKADELPDDDENAKAAANKDGFMDGLFALFHKQK